MNRLVIQERRRLLRSGLARLADDEPQVELVAAVADDAGVRAAVVDRPVEVLVVEIAVTSGRSPSSWPTSGRCGAVLVVGLHVGRRSDHAAAAAPRRST